jgi:hypothetical protein
MLKVKLSMCMLDLVGSLLEPCMMKFSHYISSINVCQNSIFHCYAFVYWNLENASSTSSPISKLLNYENKFMVMDIKALKFYK